MAVQTAGFSPIHLHPFDRSSPRHSPLRNGQHKAPCRLDLSLPRFYPESSNPDVSPDLHPVSPTSSHASDMTPSSWSTGAVTPTSPTKPAYLWSVGEVCRWLKRHCPRHYPSLLELFSRHDITGRVLLRLTEATLARMGIGGLAPRQDLLAQLLLLRLREDALHLSLLAQGFSGSL
uniref:protein aveugle-like n=1 Tax=Myxine glutinosa TaxID=7769 RepID=UPI00358F9552